MKVFESNITIESSNFPNKVAAERYERSVLEVHDKIATSSFGKAFLTLISAITTDIKIVAPVNKNQADAFALKSVDGFAQGVTFFDGKGVQQTGTGLGSSSVVEFNPHGDFMGISPDATLIHEITHAWRKARGKWDQASMAGLMVPDPHTNAAPQNPNFLFENWEEFLAIMVEDIYSAEQGVNAVRTSHNPMAWFAQAIRTEPQQPNIFNPVPLTDCQRFCQRFKPAIERIKTQELALYNLMRASKAWFNPVRDLELLPAYLANLPAVQDPITNPAMFQGVF